MSQLQALAATAYMAMSEPHQNHSVRRLLSWVPLSISVALCLLAGWHMYGLRTRMDQAQQAAAGMRTALEMTQTAVVVADEHGVVTAANPAALALFERDVLIGLPVHALCASTRRDKADNMFRVAIDHTRHSNRPSLVTTVTDIELPKSHEVKRIRLDIRVVPYEDTVMAVASITPAAVVDIAPIPMLPAVTGPGSQPVVPADYDSSLCRALGAELKKSEPKTN